MNAVISQWLGKREHQEDAYKVRHYPGGTLAVVCDGMGGHMLGDVASAAAAEAFADTFELETDAPVAERLQAALDAANDAVARVFADAGAFGGTTLTAVFAGAGVLWWISVGDSPLYLWRHDRLVRLNEDHSMRAVYMQYVHAGSLTYEEAKHAGYSLRSALTGEPPALVDSPAVPYPLLPGDRIVLTTDGADDLLDSPLISDPVRRMFEQREGNLSSRIVAACEALNNPYADNVTVICMDWK